MNIRVNQLHCFTMFYHVVPIFCTLFCFEVLVLRQDSYATQPAALHPRRGRSVTCAASA